MYTNYKIKSLRWAVNQISSLKIQGAHNVAIFSLETMRYVLNKKKKSKKLYTFLIKAKNDLIKSRPTEPQMRNSLFYIFKHIDKQNINVDAISSKIDRTIEFLKISNNVIATYGSRMISDGEIIYTHCHASTVIGILKKAYSKNINFRVHNTETRPLYQGRKTAKELSDNGILVSHFVDSAMRIAIKKADKVFIGADAITESKVYNKIGSELISEIAYRYDIPVYVCACSWKFDPASLFGFEEVIEERSSKEIWQKIPRNVTIKNYAFEKINPKLISGIISELGVLSYDAFLEEVRKKYSWMFDNPDFDF